VPANRSVDSKIEWTATQGAWAEVLLEATRFRHAEWTTRVVSAPDSPAASETVLLVLAGRHWVRAIRFNWWSNVRGSRSVPNPTIFCGVCDLDW
jgi:hypothetical protein